MIQIEKNNLYLVTGGSGYLGHSLVNYILKNGGLVRVIGRDEGKLIELKEKFPSVEIYTGDVCDSFEVRQSMIGVTGVFHLAASKHIGLAEKFVRECIKTNIIGSLNVLENSLNHDTLKFVLSISTDKAAQVSGVYGATKFLMERLIKQYEQINSSVMYRTVRYGNVLYSTGSVLCKWKDLILQGKEVIITSPHATRFFWTIDDAIQLIIECMANATDSTPYCPVMKSMRIDDLLKAMIIKYGVGKDISIKVIGLQPGENLHEKVLEDGPYSNEVDHYTIEEILSMI